MITTEIKYAGSQFYQNSLVTYWRLKTPWWFSKPRITDIGHIWCSC